MKRNLPVLLICLLCFSTSFCQHKVAFYVSTFGSDHNPGTILKPFATLEKSKHMVRQYKLSNTNISSITVYLRRGEYFLDSTFILYPEDSGNQTTPVTYSSYPGEKAVLIGGKKISNWKKLNEQGPEINPLAKGKIWVADIPTGWLFHYLFVNGKMATRSQSDHRYWREWDKDHIPGKPDMKG